MDEPDKDQLMDSSWQTDILNWLILTLEAKHLAYCLNDFKD